MTPVRLPSLDVAPAVTRGYTEAEVHSKLFEPDMAALGYPPRTSTQAEGEYFFEQRRLAVRRLQTGRQRGFFDGLYMIGNAPVVLCEIKRPDAVATDADLARAIKQLKGYAASDDFATPPPFLLLYSGDPAGSRFLRRRTMSDATLLDYEDLGEIWDWRRVKDAHAKGAFQEEVVTRARLLEILLHHLDSIEDDVRSPVAQAVHFVSGASRDGLPPPFARWLDANPEAARRMRELYERKVAEVPGGGQAQVIEEMVTQAALNYVNKVFFLNVCEDRNLPGFFRIMREFLPSSRADTTPTAATVFLALLRKRIRDRSGEWRAEEESAYRQLRDDLAPEIGAHVIEQNNWSELIRVAFDLAEDQFPLVYRADAYDYFRPTKETLAELVYDLSTKSFRALTNRHVGDIYQGLLSSRRQGAQGRSGRQRQQSTLGAFYTPRGDVDYMVSKLELTRESRVLDPCMGSGHFLEGLYERLAELQRAAGYEEVEIYERVVERQIFGADIDTFATSLAAIRLFLLNEHGALTRPNLLVHDMLLHSPGRPGAELFSPEVLQAEGREQAVAERVVSVDPEVDQMAPIDEIAFDAVIGNPPYGARKPAYKEAVYRRLYGQAASDVRVGSLGTGDRESYAMFFANGIERLREGGRLCLITNDSFRSLTTHSALRRHILDHCKIVEILLTDTSHFRGVSFKFAGMAITTLERCSDPVARGDHEMRLVDYLRDPDEFAAPAPEKVTTLRQEEYEALPETPFFVGVSRELFEAAKASLRVRDVARGRVGLQTSEDGRFLAGIASPYPGLPRTVAADDVVRDAGENAARGIPIARAHWVPFAKGEGFGEYWREPNVAIDWSEQSVAELERRAALPSGTSRKTFFRNRQLFFHAGLTYSVISSGRISARLMPSGWIFGHKGSAIFVEDPDTSEAFLLGYLNSALATYFMKRIVNTTATADIGYVEKLPYRRPTAELRDHVVDRVEHIVAAVRADPEADIAELRDEIDDAIFDLFEVRSGREEVRRYYRGVGRVERPEGADQPVSE